MRRPLFMAAAMSAALAASASAQISASRPQVKIPVKSTVQPTQSFPSSPLVGGSDDCSTAAATNAINGPGTYTIDTTLATSGAPIGSCGLIGADVWYYYTASQAGIATVATCGGSMDSVIAIWNDGAPAGSCPTTQVLCLDDSCGLETSVSFPVAAGQKFFLELGGFNGATYSATFTVAESVPMANDDCNGSVLIVGNGPHSFDTTAATTGSQGQTEAACFFSGTSAVNQDVWYRWVATATGSIELSLCNGGAAFDSKVAVYAGAGCPAAAALACNDDSCALVSALCFQATAGNTYTIQVGGYTGASGTGTFTFTPTAGPTGGCTPLDDGSSENSVALTNGGAMGWMTGFGTVAQSTTVNSVQTCFGTPLFPGFIPQGSVTVAVWDDPNDDGDPTDCVLVAQVTGTMALTSIDTDVFQTFTLSSPVTVNGIFFVGAVVTTAAGQYVAPLDQSGGGSVCSAGPQFFFGDASGTANLTNLAQNGFPPSAIAGQGLPGNWLLRVGCATNPGTPFCFGDGTGAACPCGNNAVVGTGTGCLNSFGSGGLLSAMGNPSVTSDTLVLNGSGMPNASALYFQGTTQQSAGAGAAFGDGKRCAGGTVIRLGTKTNVGGSSSYPSGSQAIHIKGSDVAGNVRTYQCWYRNAAVFCTTSTFNLTNGLQITWAP